MIKTYSFYESGVIAGIPGEWYAGQLVDVDEATMTVVDVRLMALPAQNADPPQEPQITEQAAQTLDQSPDSSPQGKGK
jgi:hypothetical protein